MLASPNQPGPQAPPPRGPLIIIGASARAAAQSAIRAGYEPWCIDLFADRDLRAIAPVKKCPRDQWPAGVLELLKDAPPGLVMLTGAMENHAEVVATVARRHRLMTGPAESIIRSRQPWAFHNAWTHAAAGRGPGGIDVDFLPGLCVTFSRNWRWNDRHRDKMSSTGGDDVPFLLKPLASGGGRHIDDWHPGDPVAMNQYVQQRIHGAAISALFVGANGHARLIGATEQLVGDTWFGARDFQFVGNIVPMPLSQTQRRQLISIGIGLAAWTRLEGVFGVDAVLTPPTPIRHQRSDCIYPVEINPRYTASIELIERSQGTCVLASEPDASLSRAEADSNFHGKAVVYARGKTRLTDFDDAAASMQIADVPDNGQVIEQGQPVCTVFARGSTRDACYAGLREMAAKVYTRLVPA